MTIEKVINTINGSVGSTCPITSRYDLLAGDRSGFLSRGQQFAQMTLPHLLNNGSGVGDVTYGYSSHAARCVDSLANKLINQLFPSHMPFFTLDYPEDAKAEIKDLFPDEEDRALVYDALDIAVRKVHSSSAYAASRVPKIEAAKHLLVCGNACLFENPNGSGLSFIPLTHYVVSRDCADNIIEFCTKLTTSIIGLPEDVREYVKSARIAKGLIATVDTKVDLYTYALKDTDGYTIIQTCEDKILKKAVIVPDNEFPWITLRYSTTYGESYGRGLVENYFQDIHTISALSEAVVRGMVLMCDVKFFLHPSSNLDLQRLNDSPSGEWFIGRPEHVGAQQLNQGADYTPVTNLIKEYERRVGHAFLLQAGNRREGERVTAYEIRLDAQEMNENLGGLYSLLADTLQRPYALLSLKREGYNINDNNIVPSILTGVDAVGRASDLDKLRVFSETVAITQQWPPELQRRSDAHKLAKKVASTLSLDIDFIRGDAEQSEIDAQMQKEQQEATVAQEAAKAAPDIITNL